MRKKRCKGCKAINDNPEVRANCLLGHRTYTYVNAIGRKIIRPIGDCPKPETQEEFTRALIKNCII
jgi:hypothetical protein